MRADKRQYHYIYKITRVDNGRYYIGMHSTDNLEDGYFGSGKLITASIKKHGKDKHVKEILEQLPSREALKLREKELVCEDLLGDKLCMNLKLGGDGGGGLSSEAHAKAFHKAGAIAANKVRTEKLQEYLKDSTFRARWIQALKDNNVGFIGRSHSQKTLEQMRVSHQGKHQGVANSQYGKCWVTLDDKSISIPRDKLDAYIEQGFRKGRVMKK